MEAAGSGGGAQEGFQVSGAPGDLNQMLERRGLVGELSQPLPGYDTHTHKHTEA